MLLLFLIGVAEWPPVGKNFIWFAVCVPCEHIQSNLS